MAFVFTFFSLNLYKSKKSWTDTCEKENKNNSKANIWQLSLMKVEETKPSWKTWLFIEKWGSFVRKYFPHSKSLYGQKTLNNYFFWFSNNWINVVFCFLSLLVFLFKAWFPLLKLFISTSKPPLCTACA